MWVNGLARVGTVGATTAYSGIRLALGALQLVGYRIVAAASGPWAMAIMALDITATQLGWGADDPGRCDRRLGSLAAGINEYIRLRDQHATWQCSWDNFGPNFAVSQRMRGLTTMIDGEPDIAPYNNPGRQRFLGLRSFINDQIATFEVSGGENTSCLVADQSMVERLNFIKAYWQGARVYNYVRNPIPRCIDNPANSSSFSDPNGA